MAVEVDVFGREAPPFGGAFSVDSAWLTFPGLKERDGVTAITINRENPMILQSAQFAYQQPITRVYDLTTKGVFYIRGQASGQGQMSQIVGPARLAKAFVETFGSVCNVQNHLLQFTMDTGDCNDPDSLDTENPWDGTMGFMAKFVVLNRVGVQMTAQQMVVQQDLSFDFGVLRYLTEDETEASVRAAATAEADTDAPAPT